MKKLSLFFLMIFTGMALLIFQGCDKSDDGGNDPNDPNSTPSSTSAGSLLGTVKSTYGSGISDVQVSVGNLTATTNSQGWFSIPEVNPGDRVQVQFESSGYVTTFKVVQIIVGQSTFVEAVMTYVGTTASVPSSGGTVSTGGASVTFGNGAFSNGGSANVAVTYFDPTEPYFAETFPGDFQGISSSGAQGTLESFGFVDVDLTDANGNAINLANGQTATITIPVPSALQSTAPATIPLWYYDESQGIWREEGYGTLQNGYYVGTVTHFTSWNYDRLYDVAYLTGTVVDGDGNPVNHAYVTADGVDYSGRSYRYTGSDGTFRIGVRPNSTVIVKAAKGGVTSASTTRTTPGNGQELNIGNIVLTAPIATITLTWGQNPRDMDSHLLVPSQSGDGTFTHISYMNYGSLTAYPYASLDTDDRYSEGPENITVVKKYTGTYSYYVHWYTGTGNLLTSQSKVTVLLNGYLYVFNVPTTGNEEYAYWHVFNMVVNESGNVSLQTVNTILETAPGGSFRMYKKSE